MERTGKVNRGGGRPGRERPPPPRGGEREGRRKKSPAAPYFPAREGSIIGAGELDFRVRDGNGYSLPAMAAGRISLLFIGPRPGTCPGAAAIWSSLTGY